MLLSRKSYKKIDKEILKFPKCQRQSAIISALAIAQDELGWISLEIIKEIAKYIHVQPIAVQEVAGFYNMFNIKRIKKYKITICTGLSCSLNNMEKSKTYLINNINNINKIKKIFTFKKSECMGSCGDAPIILINNKYMYVRMYKNRLKSLIEYLNNKNFFI